MGSRWLINAAEALRMTRWPDNHTRVPILLYHAIVRPGEVADPSVAVSQSRFDEHLLGLEEAGYSCISLNHLVAYLEGRQSVPSRCYVLTFDDGFLNTYRLAWPVLVRRKCPATVFLVVDLIGRVSEWTRPERSGPQLMLGADQILRMQAAGIDFASHGCTHSRLTDLGPAALSHELAESRKRLSELLGRNVTTLAYPYGGQNVQVREAARRAGYTAAVSVMAGWNHPGPDPMAMRRIIVSGRDSPNAVLAKTLIGDHRIRLRALVARRLLNR